MSVQTGFKGGRVSHFKEAYFSPQTDSKIWQFFMLYGFFWSEIFFFHVFCKYILAEISFGGLSQNWGILHIYLKVKNQLVFHVNRKKHGKNKKCKNRRFPQMAIFSDISFIFQDTEWLNSGILFCRVGQGNVNTCKGLLFIPFSPFFFVVLLFNKGHLCWWHVYLLWPCSKLPFGWNHKGIL